MRYKDCPQCDERFECGMNDTTCWCVGDIEKKLFLFEKVKITPIEGHDCYCKKCLEARIMQLYYNRQYGYPEQLTREQFNKMYPDTPAAKLDRQRVKRLESWEGPPNKDYF